MDRLDLCCSPGPGPVSGTVEVGETTFIGGELCWMAARAAQARQGILARDGVLLGASEVAYGEGITGPVRWLARRLA